MFWQLRNLDREISEIRETNLHLEEKVETLSLQNSSSVFNHSANSLFSELSMSQHMSQSTDSVDMAGISHNSSIHQPVSASFYHFIFSFSKINESPKHSYLQVSKIPSKNRKGKSLNKGRKLFPGHLSFQVERMRRERKSNVAILKKSGERSF